MDNIKHMKFRNIFLFLYSDTLRKLASYFFVKKAADQRIMCGSLKWTQNTKPFQGCN